MLAWEQGAEFYGQKTVERRNLPSACGDALPRVDKVMLLPVKAMPLNTMRHTLGGRDRRNKVVRSVLRDGTKLGQPDFTKNYWYFINLNYKTWRSP